MEGNPTLFRLLRAIVAAPLFLADCLLRPRPWDSAGWTPHDRPR